MNRTYRLVWNRALRVLQVASELARSHAGTSAGATAASLPRRHPLAVACIALLTLGAFSLSAWAQECVPSATQTCGSQGGNAGAGGGATSGQGGMGNGGGGQGAGNVTGAIGTGGNGGAGSYGDVQNPGGAGGSVGATSIGSVSITGGDGVTPPPGGNSSRGSGGGGGGGDGVYTTDTNLGLAAGLSITGGNGGNGAPGDTQGGGGGGGGAGVVALTAATSFTNAGSIAGGDGGDGAATGWSGGGGGGGDGVLLAGAGSALNNSGSITGGDGGTGPQAGYAFGTGGTGGSGVNVTADNTQIINSGTITAGLSANGTARGDAVKFWGTGESLTLKAGSVLNGAVEVLSGASATITAEADGLDLAGGTPAGDALIVDGATTLDTDGHAFSVSGAISGSAPLMVNGGGTLTLAGTNTFSGGTTVTPGTTLSVSSDANLGAAPTAALPNQGSITLDGGTLENTQAFTTARNITLGTLNGTFDTAADLTVSGVISGPGALFKQGAGTLTLTQANTYVGNASYAQHPVSTELDAGTLQIDNTDALGSSGLLLDGGTLLANTTGTLANAILTPFAFSATIAATSGHTLTLTGDLNLHAGNLHFGTATDTGTVVWNPVLRFIGKQPGLFVDGGTLQLGAGIAAYVQYVEGATTVASGATLDLDDQSGVIIRQLLGGGTVTTGSNATTVLTVGSGSFTGGIQGAGGLTLACDTAFSCAPGVLTLGGSGLTTYGGPTTITNTYTLQGSASDAFSAASATTVDAGGVLDLGGFNQTIGSLAGGGSVINSGSAAATLTVGGDNTSTTFDGVIQDGTAAIGMQKTGTGSLTLDGINTYTGLTEVQDGALIVGDATHATAMISGNTQVGGGATLGGFGTAGGTGSTVAVESGGILSPGAGSNSLGTLNVGGGLMLAQGSVLDFDFGAPAASNPNTTPGLSDHVAVAGTLTFDGGSTLNINDAGGMGPGLYNLASYGSLAMNNCAIGGSGTQCLALGSMPAGSQPYNFAIVNNSASKQIDLYNTAGMTLNIWAPSGNTSQLGGTGTWTAASPTWTDPAGDGPASMNPQPGFAIFQGTQANGVACATTACVVTVDDGTNDANPVSVTGMQFAVDGYTLTGNPLTLVGTTSGNTTTPPIIEVGDGSSASAGMTATISANLVGTDGFSKTGAGTLVLAAPFSVSGLDRLAGTVDVEAGTLQVGTTSAQSLQDVAALRDPVTMAAGSQLVLASGGVDPYSGWTPTAPVVAAVSGQDFSITTSTTGTGTISAIVGVVPIGATQGADAGSAIAGTGFTATFTGNTFVAGSSTSVPSLLVGAAAITGSNFQVTNANASGSYQGVQLGITGGMGAISQSGTGGTGGAGISGSGFTVTNSGGIYGGAGGPTQTGTAGAGGAGIGGSGFTLTNTGKITGGAGGGVYAGSGNYTPGTGTLTGLGGAGVSSLGGATVINEGTISGGASGTGQPAADAIDFTGGGNTLELVAGHPGTFNGAIVVTRTAGDAADTLELGGDSGSDSFDVGKLASGGTFGGFNAEEKSGASTWTLTGTGSTSENWTVAGGTLNGDATALQGNIAFAPASGATAAVVFNQGSGNANSTSDGTFAGVISGNGSLSKTGDGTLTLTGANTYTGGTTISAGTLQVASDANLGDAGGTLTLAGGTLLATSAFSTGRAINVTSSGTLDADSGLSVGGVISGAGALTVDGGTGGLQLSGDSHAFAGNTTVQSGTLAVLRGAALGGAMTVEAGAQLRGFGTVGSAGKLVTVQQGGMLAPSISSGSTGTLTVAGDLTLDAGSILAINLGTPATSQPFAQPGSSDHVSVGGTLSLGGAGAVLNLADAGGAGPGLYNLIGYGSLSTTGCAFDGSANACLAIGTVPAGTASDYVLVNNAAGKQIDLFDVLGATLNVWNANDQAKPGQMGGGDGTWSTTSKEWTDAAGLAPNSTMSPQPGFAIFGGTAGTVTVDNGAGTVSATGLQFASDGYTLTGDTLTLVGVGGSAPVIRVGDGSSAGAGMTATINNVIAGSAGLTKTDLGTLVLGGTNTFSAGLAIDGGTVSVASDANLGATSNAITLDGGTLENTAVFTTARGITLAGNGTAQTDADLTVSGVISGAGSLTKIGAGTLTLGGVNTFSGGLAIDAGTLSVASDANLGAASGAVTLNGGTLENTVAFSTARDVTLAGAGTVQTDADLTVSGVIAGAGSLTKTGVGTLILTGGNTYAGGTTVNAGSVQVGDGHTAGSITGNVIDNATLVFNRSDATSFAGVVSGTGSLTQAGSGTLTLSGTNTFSGGLAIDGGTVAVASDANLGATTDSITFTGGTLENTAAFSTTRNLSLTGNGTVQTDADLTVSGVIAGAGSLTKTGTGTLTFTGANTYSGGTTISAGTLAGNTTSLHGAIADNAALVFDQTTDGTFSGTLSGTGSLTKAGAGTLTVNGANLFAGTTTVQAGSLVVGDDSHASATLGGMVTVAAGATLGGIGTLGGLDLAGTLSPGNSVGTLHVSGNATLEQGASMRIDATPDGHADQLAVGGKVDILGGSALVLAQPGNWAPRTDYTIVTAAGGVSGQFASASASLAFLVPVLSYTANAVNLSLQRNDIGFADVGRTPNQKAAAHGAESLGWGTPVYDALVKLDAPQARHAFDQLSGEIYPGTLAALAEDDRYVRDAVNRHLLGLGEGTEGRTAGGTGAWLSGWGHWGRDDGDGNAASLRANGSGLLLGVDRTVGMDSRLGLLLGHGQNSLDVDQRASSAHVRSRQLGVYGDTSFGALQLRAAAIHAWQDVDTQRTAAFPGFDERLASRRHVRSDQAYVEAGYRLTLPHGQQLEPFVNLAHTQLHAGAVRESNGQAALVVAAADPSVSSATLGLRDTFTSKAGLHLHASLAWQQGWGDITPVATMRFAAGGDGFAVAGVPLARHALLANLGTDFPLARNITLDVSYLGQFTTRYRDQGARLSLAIAF